MVSVGRHPNIELLAYSEVEDVSGYVGNYKILVRRKARIIDEEACAACGSCVDVCPIDIINTFDHGLSMRKAVYRNSAQAVPSSYVIEKRGIAPCRAACPTDQRAMGYIALIRQKRYADAYWAIRREHPFPSVCGRVCNKSCEDACSRSQFDEPVNIMGLKRFVADWAYDHRHELPNMRDKSLIGTPFQHHAKPSGKKVAIIGAGPAGLTAGLDLVRLGHRVTIFDLLPEPGGMMRVGIPPHRLPPHLLNWEIQQILDEGVELRLNTRVDDIPGLFKMGYHAVIVATGAHLATKLSIPGSDHPDNWLSLDLLRQACLGEDINFSGREIIVLGAGDVALDAARTAIRLGNGDSDERSSDDDNDDENKMFSSLTTYERLDVARMALRLGNPKVRIVCRGMRASFNEIEEALAEGVEIINNRVFKEIVVKGEKIIGVLCLEAEVGEVVDGKRQVREIPGTGDSVSRAQGSAKDNSDNKAYTRGFKHHL